MATKSIMRNIKVTDRPFALRLARALENAKGKKPPAVTFQRPVDYVAEDEVKAFLERIA